jgi:putative ABC transport system permease protein
MCALSATTNVVHRPKDRRLCGSAAGRDITRGRRVKYLPLIWSGIWRKRGRTILTASQVLVAFTLFGLLQGMKSGIDDIVNKIGADMFVVQRANGFGPMPLSMYSRIQAVAGVKSVTYESYLGGTYKKPTQQVFAIACDLDSERITYADMTISRQAIEAMKQTRTGVLVSDSLAHQYGWKSGDRIPLESQTKRQDGSGTWTLDVVGTFTPGDNYLSPDFMLMNYAYLDEARESDRGTAQQYFLKVDDPKQGLSVARAVDNLFANSSDETRTQPQREAVQSALQSLGDLDFVIRAVVGAVLFALIFSTSAMVMQSIRERTAEFAVLKTLGFSDSALFWLVLSEVLCLFIAAAVLGLALASCVLPAARNFTRLNVTMPASVLSVGLGMAAALAVVTAILPAMRAQRLQVVDALAGR